MSLEFIYFNLFIIAMLIVDFALVHRNPHVISLKEALGWSIFWITLALIFNIGVYYTRGTEDALDFLAGYLIEKSLSVDNLFIFLVIFNYFKVPKTSMYKVLFWGVFAAIVFRAIFILVGVALVKEFYWILYLFGILLIYTGVKLLLGKETEVHPEQNVVLRLFKRFMPITHHYENDQFFVVKNGKYWATPLFVVLLAVETTDIVFAADSIPAIMAITLDPFIIYTSNIFAILGLRSLYFLLSGMIGIFHYLNYGLGVILTAIGIKMLLEDFVHVPIIYTLSFIIIVLTISIILSIVLPNKKLDVK